MSNSNYLFKLLPFLKNILPKKILDSIILSISKKKMSRLEITSTIGCAMMCDYCPQTLIKLETRKNNLKRKLEMSDFVKFMSKVPIDTQIHWSGYSEPLAHEDFPKFVKFLKDKNYKQLISTTMFGRRETEIFMSKFKGFRSVTFHLPDDKNLMKLKVTDRYMYNLENAIRFQAAQIKDEVYFLVFGKNFHPKIELLLKKLVNENVINEKSIEVRKHLHSRASSIDTSNLSENVEEKNNNEPVDFKSKTKKFYCGHARLNQGVLIPNGDINLCCHDYSLSSNIGNLHTDSLNDIYKQKIIFNNGFSDGNHDTCKKCEYYKSF